MVLSLMGLNIPTGMSDLLKGTDLPIEKLFQIIKDLQYYSLIRTIPGGYVRLPRHWPEVHEILHTTDPKTGDDVPVVWKDEYWMSKKKIFAAKKRGRRIDEILKQAEIPERNFYYEVISIMKDNHQYRFLYMNIPVNVSGKILDTHKLVDIDGWVCWSWRK